MGERGLLATTAAMLAQALYAQGRYEEARRHCDVSEAAAPEEDLVTHTMWRGVRAKLLARAGRLEAAEALARDALELIEPTDLLTMRADAFHDLAEVLGLQGRADEAGAATSRANELLEQKGCLAAATQSRDGGH